MKTVDTIQGYSVQLAKEQGLVASVLFNQLKFWANKGKRSDGWVFKTYSELEEELGIPERTLRRAYQKLEKAGLIETQVLKAHGAPTKHFRIGQNGRMDSDKMAETMDSDKMAESITETTINNSNRDSVSFGGSDTPPKAPPRELLQQIIDIVNPREKITDSRLKDLNGRLKDYTPEEIIASAKAFSKSEWHKENKQMSIDNLIRASKFGRWYAQAQEEKTEGYVPPTPEEQAKIDELNRVEDWNDGDK